MSTSTIADVNRRILVIDDNPAIHEDFRKVLADGTQPSDLDAVEQSLFGSPVTTNEGHGQTFRVDSAYQGREGLEKVREAMRENNPYAMAFVDVRMPPGWDGIETIAHIWRDCPDIEVVICTAYSDYNWHTMMERLSRSDRLLILKKPFDNIEVQQLAWSLTSKWNMAREIRTKLQNLDELVRNRTLELQNANDSLMEQMAERKKAEEQLKHFAFHDPLTSLPNRALFMDRLKQAVRQRFRKAGDLFSVLYMDLDGFKAVNDKFGHEAGDSVLIGVAKRFKEMLRPGDTLARMGGDEFTIILENISKPSDVEIVTDRLHGALKEPFLINGETAKVSVSIGTTLGDQWKSADELLREADSSMYLAKTSKKS